MNIVYERPSDFVYISDIDDRILQKRMYYTDINFVGRAIDGYVTNSIMLTKDTVLALKKAQDILFDEGYHIVIYDGYRPMRATNDFIRWVEDTNDIKMKKYFYPLIEKCNFFNGYLSKMSAHTRGSAVDISIIEKGKELKLLPNYVERCLLDSRKIMFLDDNTIDMYTSVDLLDPASSHDSVFIPYEYNVRRRFLSDIMVKSGFQIHIKEWWHYSLKNEEYPDTYFDYVESKK